MSAVFVHLSDIHFGQERDDTVHIHEDVKQQLIADAAEVLGNLPGRVALGILVTGDIAYSGKRAQYDDAGRWLDELARSIGCPIHMVQMVPGNHDVDRDKLSVGGSQLLAYIRAGGAAEYERVVNNPADRASLLARFEDYGRFSCGYDCALDGEARFATNRRIELAPGRWIRFIRMNSALLCHGKERDDAPELMIGARQFTIPRNTGEENVLLVHHPLNWYRDADEVRQYVRSRARVFISGHEHDPKVTIDPVDDGCDVMMVAAGAAVPFKSNEAYTYTYNIIEFDWDEEADALAVTMHPRAWNPKQTRFEADTKRLGGSQPRFVLGSPNFRKCAQPNENGLAAGERAPVRDEESDQQVVEFVAKEIAEETPPMTPPIEGYELTLLRFFRDLLENERLRILVELNAIPVDSDERMTQGVERKLFDWLAREGRLLELGRMIDKLIEERDGGQN
ncbi:MAG TPA: metallophosphoesterase [Magnetospirillum sp.]|nr:metallophosphoesterase [Magnetospirillum sp.]